MLGGVVVEHRAHVEVVAVIFAAALGHLTRSRAANTLAASAVRSSAFQISTRAVFAPGCADFGRSLRTLAIWWNQHRCSRVVGNTAQRPRTLGAVP